MSDFVMPVSFYFTVYVDGGFMNQDMAFQEVTGLEVEMETQPVIEGGENRFVHKLPKSIKHPNLVLKRGIADRTSSLTLWCQDVLEMDFAKDIVPRDVVVGLCNATGIPIRTWSIGNAYPVKWNVSSFNAMKNEIAIESMEFVYSTLERKA